MISAIINMIEKQINKDYMIYLSSREKKGKKVLDMQYFLINKLI